MRYLFGFVLLLLALGTLRVVGCGDEPVDERIPCQAHWECDDQNECTDDRCVGEYCHNTDVVVFDYPRLALCDLDGVEQFYEDGVCVSGICERRRSCTALYMCEDWICKPEGDRERWGNYCTRDMCDEGTCTYTPEPNGSFCCYAWERFNCSFTAPCDYKCTRSGECQDGQCCLAGNCYESRPRGYGCDPWSMPI